MKQRGGETGVRLLGPRERERINLMLWAFLYFNMRKTPQKQRELVSWSLLLEWARLGGTRDEVII